MQIGGGIKWYKYLKYPEKREYNGNLKYPINILHTERNVTL